MSEDCRWRRWSRLAQGRHPFGRTSRRVTRIATLVEGRAAYVGSDDWLASAFSADSRLEEVIMNLWVAMGLAFVLDLAFALWVADMSDPADRRARP
jgi:hypothetical protein